MQLDPNNNIKGQTGLQAVKYIITDNSMFFLFYIFKILAFPQAECPLNPSGWSGLDSRGLINTLHFTTIFHKQTSTPLTSLYKGSSSRVLEGKRIERGQRGQSGVMRCRDEEVVAKHGA